MSATITTWQIYCLRDPRTGAIRYVGRTDRTSRRRLIEHLCYSAINQKSHKERWIALLLRNGLKPMCEILETGSGDSAAAERRWIASLKASGANLTNSTDGGDGLSGHAHSPETRAKLSKPRSAEGRARIAAANKRRVLTAEQRQRISETTKAALTGRRLPPEQCANISAALKGKPFSPEHRRKLSEAQKTWLDGDPSRREELRTRPHTPETHAKIAATVSKLPPISAETRAKKAESMRKTWAAKKAQKGGGSLCQ